MDIVLGLIAVTMKLGIIIFLLMMIFYFVRTLQRIATATEQMAESQAETARQLAKLAADRHNSCGE